MKLPEWNRDYIDGSVNEIIQGDQHGKNSVVKERFQITPGLQDRQLMKHDHGKAEEKYPSKDTILLKIPRSL